MAKAEYRSAIRSRNLIKSALGDLLLEKALDKVTVTDVVNRAQINRGTFYAHFINIPDVIDTCVQEAFSRMADAISTDAYPLEELPTVLMNEIQSILEEDLEFYRKVMTSSISAFVCTRLADVMLEYLLQPQWRASVADSTQYDIMIRFCAGGLSSLYKDWFAGKVPISLTELSEQAANMLTQLLRQITDN